MAWYNPATWKPVDVMQGQRSWNSDPRTVAPAPAPSPFIVNTGRAGRSGSEWRNPAQDSSATDYINALKAESARLQAQVSAMPRLPSFDILGNYNRAKTQAEANQRPRYDKMLNTFLEGQGIKRTAKQQETALGKEQVETERRYSKEDNATNRERTAEDVLAALGMINTQEGQFQEDEGDEFDRARRALQETVAATGLTASGMGQGQVAEQAEERNTATDRQTEQFQIQRQAKEMFKNRTFADLARGDLRADEKATLANKNYDFNLDSFLTDLVQEEKVYRQNWEGDLLGAIAEETGRLEGEGTAQFLATLPGSGKWRAQDIALAHQIYR